MDARQQEAVVCVLNHFSAIHPLALSSLCTSLCPNSCRQLRRSSGGILLNWSQSSVLALFPSSLQPRSTTNTSPPSLKLTMFDFHAAVHDFLCGTHNPQCRQEALTEIAQALGNTLKAWECVVMGLLAVDLAITLYGLGAKVPDTVLPISDEVALVAFTELVVLVQLMQVLLPVYPAEEFAMFAVPRNFTRQSVCRWAAGLFGLQEAEFPGRRSEFEEDGPKAFGVFLIPVAAAVLWKWHRVRRRQREMRREEQAALVARTFRMWEAWRRDN
ncbi:hypothetical protein CTA2_5537 [Colletotrichum tanaceti]|uniref:Uncharacterized protein n=1 Tax=Colletotrichum tanaceti TaxID=1306861 RepID=A0A4U6X9R2_9PEZI|nr:hypothetical protein CTA2_5537 [Colletotrichum tanaceti]TKW51809.1 hypothetical protein CTA1_1872 [Colletotrichum tanaceti]